MRRRKAGIVEKLEYGRFVIVAEALARVKKVGEKTVVIVWPRKIHHVKRAAWAKHATYLTKSALLFVVREVVIHQ